MRRSGLFWKTLKERDDEDNDADEEVQLKSSFPPSALIHKRNKRQYAKL